MYPHLNLQGVVGAVHLPLDGQCDPANIAMALAKGARQLGAQFFEGVKVTAVHAAKGRVSGVSWAAGGERARSRPTSSSTAPACGRASSARARA